MSTLLSTQNLQVSFSTEKGEINVVRGVDLSLNAGEMVALVGESGCGKSVTAHSIMGLLPKPAGHITGGDVQFAGESLINRAAEYRGKKISMIFQEPMTALNPVFPVGKQIAEVFR